MAKKEPAEIGHNNVDDKLKIKHVEKCAVIQQKIAELNGKLKDELNTAKNNGFLKTSIRKALKKLHMNEEQRQAKTEVEIEAERIFELCRDLPLFAALQETEENVA